MFPISRKRGIVRNFKGRNEFMAEVDKYFDRAVNYMEKHGYPEAVDILYQIPVVFFPKGGNAGTAKYRRVNGELQYNIEFNVAYIHDQYEDMVNDTVPHEIAHVMAHIATGKMDHGPVWKRMCKAIGGTADRTHNYEVKRARRTRKILYVASCGTEIWVTKNMHTKIQNGSRRFLRNTGGKLRAEHCQWKEKVVE